ncbi:hypothetical protein [Sinorhizobium meliloti]|uniref:hypothetical protein n=1 Tax=Rhizobium meliloti TaxID=382 RepID=UPI000FD710E3|nr:hypothetical protein [Sinorhizobium meliloti]RVI52154.1 hypothetical protein CN195_11950 [Sinorhizobium meliloti]
MNRPKDKRLNYLDGFAAGAFISTLVFLITFMFIDFHLKDDDWVSFFGNLVVALFSIGAALFALEGNRAQMRQASEIEEDRRQRSLAAARAVLPAILSELCLIAMNNMRLRFAEGHLPIGYELPPATAFQTVPDHIIQVLKEVIQNSDPLSQERLSNILRHFQVFQARRTGAEAAIIEPHVDALTLPVYSAISEVIGWAVIYAMTSSAFGFARGIQATIPRSIEPSDVRSAFFSAGVVLESYPNLEQILATRTAEGRLELNWAAQ